MRRCAHRWLITYDDSPRIRTGFSFAQIDAWQLQYGMNNYRQGSAGKGRELFISNYDPGDSAWRFGWIMDPDGNRIEAVTFPSNV